MIYIYIYILLCVCVTSTSKLSRLVGGGATLVEVASPHQWEEAYWLRAQFQTPDCSRVVHYSHLMSSIACSRP